MGYAFRLRSFGAMAPLFYDSASKQSERKLRSLVKLFNEKQRAIIEFIVLYKRYAPPPSSKAITKAS
jgi:hypothetical protein